MLELSLPENKLRDYLSKQIENNYPDGQTSTFNAAVGKVLFKVLSRLEMSFSRIKSRYYSKASGIPYFNHLNGDHYSAFLYLISNELYKLGEEVLASKVFLLNKQMFGIDAFYRVELPEVFLFVHPIGTVLGNATYSNFFVVYQGVTIGSKTDGIYPKFSERTILYSNSSVIGNCNFGENIVVAANSTFIDRDADSNQVLLGHYPANRFVYNNNNLIESYFNI